MAQFDVYVNRNLNKEKALVSAFVGSVVTSASQG